MMRKYRLGELVMAYRLGAWEQARVVGLAYHNVHSPAGHVGDHYIVEFSDRHRAGRYSPEVSG